MPFDTPSRSAASALAAARCPLATRVGTCTAPARCTNSEGAITIGSTKDVTKESRMQQVKGVVARSKGAPVEVVTINVPDLGPGEAVVKGQACAGVRTHMHYT